MAVRGYPRVVTESELAAADDAAPERAADTVDEVTVARDLDAAPELETPVAAANSEGESSLTVLLALGANLGVGALKLAAGLITGSAALLSEAAHSAGDSTTEVLLLVAQRRSMKPADRSHPFGYGKERYFWSLIAAVAILVSGAAFSFYQGLDAIFGAKEASQDIWINYPVLLLAAILEGTSLRQAAKQMRGETSRLRLSVRAYLRTPRDPTINSVLLEDSAAIVGLVVAALGVGLHQATGNQAWDGAASLVIAALLLVVAFVLARANEGLLIGKQADPRFVREVEAWLEEQPEVDDVVDLLTMRTGTDSILLCARADFVNSVSSGDLEKACVRLDTEMRQKWPSLDEIFIQPASRKDASMRRRVEQRYGQALAEE
jgi:cation diffusion facilitator family transporter